ncbi:uncharacterized protein LOC108261543 isoform X2 [Ictalurus punctatus]|uniref:Uncharacterized protein LOC108261543 isoform X2 n=1 Tax=Ictalurus punctatus TaxID=7998 RepID=A0A9F7QZR8_ICTPU|nr:uncharacterized protein LOC108261543 isoform X2 [Ictalurus punctatus]
MQSCSVHHCVLLLLTLTFTTAPVAAGDCPTLVKLHQPVTLPCAHDCSGEAKWTMQRNRDVVFAQCDQTSCSSVVKGYEMSHDQYLKGDLSLTITAAEYSMRNTYACECGGLDYSIVRLSIETVFSAVQKNPGEDLILDLTVPEPVEVIYTSSDSADGERICNVTQRSLQCKAEYTHRTSLRYPELTLRDVTHSDRGLYTIRDTENNEDIRVYAVSVTAVVSAVQKNPGEDLILDLSVPEPVEVIYTSSDSADGERICNVTQHSLQCKAEYTHRTSLRYPELTLRDVTHSDRGRYTIRDTENNEDIRVYSVSVTAVFSAVQKNPGEDLILDLSVPEPVQVIYTSSDSADGEQICNVTQHSLQCKAEYTHRTSLRYPELTLRDVTHSDSGRYTIRDTENNEDIRVYAVSVTAVFSAVQVKHDGDLILDLTVPEPVEVIYTSSDSADGERICNVTQRSLQCKAEYTLRTSLRYPELTLRGVTHGDSGLYTIRDTENKEDIRVYAVAVTAVFSAVQVKHDGDLILDLTVPEPVEVIYTSSDSADGERICNVTQHSLQCKAEYTHRTSLRYPELTLRDVTHSDSGLYTIRDTENKEDIRVYSVSVTDDQSGFPVWGIIVMVLILLAVFTGVFIYLKMAPHQEFLKLSRQLQCVDKLVKQSLPREDQSNKQFIMTGAALQKAEKEIDKLQQQYTHSSKYSEQVSLFCQAKRSELNKYRVQYRSDEGPLLTERDGIIGKMEEVMNSLQQLRGGARREQQVTSSSSTAMDEMEIRVEKHLEEVEKWCGERRVELNDLIQQHRGGAARDLRLVEIKS